MKVSNKLKLEVGACPDVQISKLPLDIKLLVLDYVPSMS